MLNLEALMFISVQYAHNLVALLAADAYGAGKTTFRISCMDSQAELRPESILFIVCSCSV